MVSSHSSDTNQRPAGSRDTVTVVGVTPSGRGRDQRMSNGPDIFANVSSPLRQVNAERVYSADARDLFRDLNLGYFARRARKFANAVCGCRSACWSGTLDTLARNAISPVFFHAVSAADDSTYETRRCSPSGGGPFPAVPGDGPRWSDHARVCTVLRLGA